MSARRLWWWPGAALLALAAVLGFREGLAFATLAEGDVIAAYAARHAASHPGARAADCVAIPGKASWLVVHCRGDRAAAYHVNRFGGLKRVTRGAEAVAIGEPRT